MNLSGVDLNLLVALDALLTERSVTRAAARVGLSQPAMSNALRRLRVLLGDPLFVHTRRGMFPTARAQAVATQLQHALGEIRQVVNPTATFDPASSQRRFHIAITDYGEMIIIPALIHKTKPVAPNISFNLKSFDGVNVRAGLQSGEIDLGISWRIEEQPFDARGFYTTLLFKEELVCVVRANHPNVHQRLTLKQFVALEHVVIAPSENYHPIVDLVLAQHNLVRRVAIFGSHFLAAPFIVAQTDMIATMATRLAQALSKSLDLQIFKPPVKLPALSVRLVWHERSQYDPAHQWLRNTLTQLAPRF